MSYSRQPSLGAVVVGANYRALSVVRSLGRHGVPVWLLRTDEHQVACWSRYVTSRLDMRGIDGEGLVARLASLSAVNDLRGWALMPTCDDEVELFSRHADELTEHFRVGAPPAGQADWALDKRKAYELAARHDVEHPRTWPAPTIAALRALDLDYPVIVKPGFRPRHIAATTPKAWRAEDPDQLEAAYLAASTIMPPERLMVQDLIPGGGESQLAYGALARDGEVLASIAVRRLRQWPPEFGMASTFVETVEEEELADPARRLIAAADFSGLVELEFKRDPCTGRPVLLDVNPRPWGWISLGPSAGVDFSYLYWRMLTGREVRPARARAGVRWVRMSTDLPAAATAVREDRLSVRSYLRGLRPRLACAIAAPDDPVPAVLDAPLLVGIGVRRKLRQAARAPSLLRPRTRAAAPVPDGGLRSNGQRQLRALILLENASVPGDRRPFQEALSLRRAGWDVTILAPHAWGAGRRPDEEVLDGIRIRRFKLRPAEDNRLGYLGEYSIALWRIWREIRTLSNQHPFDVIQACNPPDFLLLAALGQRRRGTRLIFDHHDLGPEMYASRSEGSNRIVHSALRALERLAFKLADVALATNGSVKQVAVERDRAAPEGVFVVRNGPILERFVPVPPDPSLARGRRHLLAYVGLMGPQDGLEHALYALAELARRRDDWHAVFLGSGEMLPSLVELTAQLGLSDHVEFAGYAEDEQVRRTICSADVCLAPDPRNPYTDRSTLIKIAEYMALGRPTVGYDLTESRVTAGGAALFATDNDPVQFADRIAELLDDPELRRALGEEGRARVEREFSWAHSEKALLAAYNAALNRRSLSSGAADTTVRTPERMQL
jgi:predicted ATP-grasp superfamily ATP-dependent carboligase/glycosyltransferase involved in cell wall biosynthesis